MFQFHQSENNSQLLFHVIVSPRRARAFSKGFTTNIARQCRAFSRALKIEKLKAPLFPGPGGAGDASDWCITLIFSGLVLYEKATTDFHFYQTLMRHFCWLKWWKHEKKCIAHAHTF